MNPKLHATGFPDVTMRRHHVKDVDEDGLAVAVVDLLCMSAGQRSVALDGWYLWVSHGHGVDEHVPGWRLLLPDPEV